MKRLIALLGIIAVLALLNVTIGIYAFLRGILLALGPPGTFAAIVVIGAAGYKWLERHAMW